MKRICVFCGSNSGGRPAYQTAAENLGRVLADRKIELIYGGASVGIMGRLADTVLAGGGTVVGVMPRFLVEKEVAHGGLSELIVVDSMHERKHCMARQADGFIALPGGFGTLDEFFEMLTWSQLRVHQKPCGLLDVDRYFHHLMRFLDHAAGEGFVHSAHREMILVDEDPRALLERCFSYTCPDVEKRIDAEN